MSVIPARLAPILCVLLLACAAPPTYRAAEGGGPGYSETDLGDGRWRVQYRGATGQGLDEVENGLLLRAAELVRAAGHPRFAVVARGVESEGGLRGTTIGVGVGGGGGGRVGWSIGAPILVGDGGPARRIAYAEIRALPSGARSGAEIYEATTLIAALRPKLAPQPDQE